MFHKAFQKRNDSSCCFTGNPTAAAHYKLRIMDLIYLHYKMPLARIYQNDCAHYGQALRGRIHTHIFKINAY